MEQEILSRTAAVITANALFELFPGIELRGSNLTSFGFCCHFYFPHPIHEELLFQIEEKMRQIIREKRPIQTLEMVPLSAQELLSKEGYRARAREAGKREGLVQIAQIGSFYDLTDGPLLKNTMELGACKILSLEQREKQGLVVIGAARRSKQELKDFLKKWASYPQRRHEAIGEGRGYWRQRPEGILWLPPGLRVRQRLFEFLKKHLFEGVLEIESPSREVPRDLGDKIGQVVFEVSPYHAEVGLLQGGRQTVLQITCFSRGAITSLLQTIGKTLNILGFDLSIQGTSRGKREALEGFEGKVDFLVEDGLNRLWEAASLAAGPNGSWTLSISVERNLALLIERDLCKGMVFENQ